MKRRQRRKAALLAVLAIALVLLGLWYWNFRATKSIRIDMRALPQDTVTAPTYLFSFAGTAANHLQSPVGVLADSGQVFVSDAQAGLIFVFKQDGTFVRTFGAGHLTDPLYIAKNPKSGLLYVADRRERAVVMFKESGEFVGVFDPKLPKSELPKFDTHGDQWVPIALGFAPDGSLYVAEILNGQRILTFAPDGSFVRSFGSAGVANTVTDLPGQFQFPNSIKVHNDELWVVDSNNRRIQVFGLDGTFKRFVAVSGLPRGLAFVNPPTNSASGTVDAFAIVDVLSSDVSIFTVGGTTPATFGERGVAEGQFNLPNDVSVGDRSVLFVTDNKNVRVQAWGWTVNVSPLPHILPQQPAWLLFLLPLLLLPLFFRTKKFYATYDFVEAMLDAGVVSRMKGKRRTWFVSEEDYERLRERSEGDIMLSELLEATEHSPEDARALKERLDIEQDQSVVLAAAQRVKYLCTESPELRRLAKILEIDVLNSTEFLEHFPLKKK